MIPFATPQTSYPPNLLPPIANSGIDPHGRRGGNSVSEAETCAHRKNYHVKLAEMGI